VVELNVRVEGVPLQALAARGRDDDVTGAVNVLIAVVVAQCIAAQVDSIVRLGLDAAAHDDRLRLFLDRRERSVRGQRLAVLLEEYDVGAGEGAAAGPGRESIRFVGICSPMRFEVTLKATRVAVGAGVGGAGVAEEPPPDLDVQAARVRTVTSAAARRRPAVTIRRARTAPRRAPPP
jgi:hypothetical protein